MWRCSLAGLLILAVWASAACAEVFRIRITNREGGLVQVSLDGGKLYGTVGRVTVPAIARIQGFAAASYVDSGAVAAAAVHGLRIKTGQYARGVGLDQKPMVFSVTPAEYARIPSGYGGHRPGSSAIHTDIPAGRAIFRDFAPYVGSRVYVERNRVLKPIPSEYVPVKGEVFVIVVEAPADSPQSVEFANTAGGKVVATYADGRSEVIARVVRPVRGVGRYDGTTFTGVGLINTNHPGVVTVSTAPVRPPGTREGEPPETRGGFMIQPRYHAAEHRETSPQVMVVESARDNAAGPVLEGTPPLFFGCISLSRRTRAEVKIDDGDWEPAPQIVGKADGAFTPAYLEGYFARQGRSRKVEKGVTALRILLHTPDRESLAATLNEEVIRYLAAADLSGLKPPRGQISAGPTEKPRAKSVVKVYVDGTPVALSNAPPYSCTVDTTRLMDGLHYLEVETVRESSGERRTESRLILIRNG